MEESWWYPVAEAGLEAGRGSGNQLSFKFPVGVNLRVAAAEWQPFTQVSRDPTTGATLVSGPSVNLLRALATSLNFTYTLVEGDGLFGARQPNGSWNGVIGMALRGEVDLILGPLSMTYERMEEFAFTQPLILESFRILQARPSTLPEPLGLLAPFSNGVWAWFAAAILAVTLASLTLGQFLGSRGRPFPVDHMLASVAVITGKALPWEPRPLPLRVIMGVWMLAAIIITQSYGGSLTSLLAVQKVPAKYDSLRQVLSAPNATLLLESSTAFTAFFLNAKQGIYKELGDTMTTRGLYMNAQELWDSVPLLRDGQHVIILEERTGLKFMSDSVSLVGKCELYLSSEYFFPSVIAMGGPKGSPLLPLLNARIRMLREYGVYNAWISSELQNISQCLRPLGEANLQPYSVKHLMGAFILLGAGLGVAMVIFVLEQIPLRVWKRKRKKDLPVPRRLGYPWKR